MWSASEESSGAMESDPPDTVVHTKETCEQNKSQLESLKEIMMRNQESLKKKEEEAQEYARRLSKIKSRAKLSRRSKGGASSSKDSTHLHKTESTAKDITDDTVDDISQAKTPKAKSSLLQRKLAENRIAFEQRNKELTETKRAVEEKVEAIRQQLEETDVTATEIYKDQSSIMPIRPVVITSDMISPIQMEHIQEKEDKIIELSNKIVGLEATILDLQENLKEKDSVIDSKMKAVTLMSADLSKKGKTTLDTLEDTKDEMRTMQENFILIETSLKNKNISLLEQLQERDNRISELEHTVNRFEERIKEQQLAESVNADFSRSTMDTLAETKDAMKSMQENFVLIESSLKLKNDNLLQQLGDYEIRLAETKERIFQLESGAGIVTTPEIENLQFRIEKLEQSNRQLLDEKYELQKNIAEMQDKIIANRFVHGNGAIMEKDNRIAELENLIEELKRSNELLEEESKAELQKQIFELASKNEEYSNKVTDLEKQMHELEVEKNYIAAKLSDELAVPKEDDKVKKLTKELEELNKSMIKLKSQHKNKVKNLQKELENFKMVSDTNAELVRLGNQVALLEEEKGNLQLSLVDFDELKASAGDWQERVADLESKVSTQTKEIQMHIDAITTLENQKLDLMQELHAVKQAVSALEVENAKSENLRVTAEMKVVDLEEQLETVHEEQNDNKLKTLSDSEYNELLKKIDALTQENSDLYNKLSKVEEKGASDTGSTESFEAIQVNDRNDLLKRIEELEQNNNELTLKLTKSEEKDNSQAGSTESFETINDTDRSELLKKIEQLTQENTDLTMKLSRIEEKGSSDTGSTESFERIPEHNENMTKIELLTQENNELVIKLTKLEEKLSQIEHTGQLDACKIDSSLETIKDDGSLRLQIETLTEENDNLIIENSKLRTQIEKIVEDNNRLQDRINVLTAENSDLVINRTKLEERLEVELSHTSHMSAQIIESTDQINVLTERQQNLEKELEALRDQLVNVTSCETDDAKSKVAVLEKENTQMVLKITQLEEYINGQKEEMNKIIKEKEELSSKLQHTAYDDLTRERLELIDKLEKLNHEKESVEQERHELREQSMLLQKLPDENLREEAEESVSRESQAVITASLEREVENNKVLIAEYKNQIEEMNMKLQNMETELEKKAKQLEAYEASGAKLESLERELKEMFITAEEWKFKYDDMQTKMQALEQEKTSIEKAFRTLESGNKDLLEVMKEKDVAIYTLQEQLQGTIELLESKLQNEIANVTAKECEIANLKADMESKDQELHAKYMQLQNEMIAIDSLQDELNNYSIKLKENEATLSSSLEEITRLNNIIKEKEDVIRSLNNSVIGINEALEQSKPLAEFNELQENLRIKEAGYIELQNKYEDILRENHDLGQKIKDISKNDEDIKNELIKKEQEIVSLLADRKDLEAHIEEITNDKTKAENKIWELRRIADNETTYVENMRSELSKEYKQMELLKAKHIEDMTMLNQRLEDVIEELNAKILENEAMKADLENNKELLGKNITEEMKTILEDKVATLEQKLSESENKMHMQSEKMKRIVATFNKKKIVCQELEARVAELEEKWTTEKDEKEAKNKKIQEVENSIREKDNKIADLEEKLLQAKNEISNALASSEKLTSDSTSLKEKMGVLMEQITEMGEEIERQRTEIDRVSLEVLTEKMTKENIVKEYEAYKQTATNESEQKQMILDEVKEEARELSVRMQVMETEYVEQLALIKNLKAENGLLSSKQTQINEKLENAEKESEERRLLIEKLQKDTAIMATVAIQVPEENVKESEIRAIQHCDHSEQCQNLIRVLETRLQESEAEIENLNNELANSYSTIDEVHDNARTYYDLMLVKAEQEFCESFTKHIQDTFKQEIDSLKEERSTSEQRISELETELIEYKRKNAEFKAESSKIVEVPTTVENQHQQTQDIPQLFDASKIFGVSITPDADTSDKREAALLQSLLDEKESRCSEYIKEIDLLQRNIEDMRLHILSSQSEYDNEIKCMKNQLEKAQDELKKFEYLLAEKNIQVDSLNVELDKTSVQINELKMLKEQYHNAQAELKRLEQFMIEKDARIDSLDMELKTVNQQMDIQLQQRMNIEDNLRTEISIKYIEINSLETELISVKEIVDVLTTERDQQNHILESCKLEINRLETEMKNTNDADIGEWQQRISETTAERDLLQLQVNDLTRSLKELNESFVSQNNLQTELENAVQEMDQTQVLITNLTQTLEDLQQHLHRSRTDGNKELTSAEKPEIIQVEPSQVPVEEIISQQEYVKLAQAPIEKNMEQDTQLDIGLNWDNGSSEKLNVDEESWGWNAEDAQLAGDEHLGAMTLMSNTEVRWRAQVEDLQDTIKDLETQNAKIAEESKAAQVKSGKLVKKLKEYKIQIESLQQQLKTQKQAGSFFNLDTAIEEELKGQIAGLEKSLGEIKEEKKTIIAEKEALLKRLDVIVSANERYMEMKERQDMEVEVLRIQNKELGNKMQSLEWRLQDNATSMENISSSQYENQVDSYHEADTFTAHDQPQKRSIEDFEVISKKYKEEIDDLKNELEALATENEQLQHLLEEQKTRMSNLEWKGAANIRELMEKLEILNDQNTQLQSTLNKTKEEYDILKKQNQMDMDNQVAEIRHLLKIEFLEKIDKLNAEINNLREEAEVSNRAYIAMEEDLTRVMAEKSNLQDKLNILMDSEGKYSINKLLEKLTSLLSFKADQFDLKRLDGQSMVSYEVECELNEEIRNLIRELDDRKKELESLRQALNDQEHESVQQRSMETVNIIVSEPTRELAQNRAAETEEKKEVDLAERPTVTLQSTIYETTLKLQDIEAHPEAQIVCSKEDLVKLYSIVKATKAEVDSLNKIVQERQQKLIQHEKQEQKLLTELNECLMEIENLRSQMKTQQASTVKLQDCNLHIQSLEHDIQNIKSEKEWLSQKIEERNVLLDSNKKDIYHLESELQEKINQLHGLNAELCCKRDELDRTKASLIDKDILLQTMEAEMKEQRAKLERLQNQQPQTSSNIDDLPVFRMSTNDDVDFQSTIDELKPQMEAKQQELEHLKCVLSENTYPTIIQEMQDRINCLYNEKATLESSLGTATETLAEKQEQVNLLMQRINVQNQEHISKEDIASFSGNRRSAHDQEEIVRLQNELHMKEQEINELKYVIAEKDSQLLLQASMEPQSDDFQLQETVQILTGDLYAKEQEVHTLKSTIAELQNEILRYKDLEKLSEEYKNAMQMLTSEKEQVRIEAEEFLSKELQKKELEIDEIKRKLSEENKKPLMELQLKDRDIENLRMQMEQLQNDLGNKLRQKESELLCTIDDLAERDRRLAELSITKDAELHNLKVQIYEKEARIEELLLLSAEEEKQLNELRESLVARETEVKTLKELLEQKVSEFELIQHALKKDVSVIEAAASKSSENVQMHDNKEAASSELDLALYMLHQRDVRCEELTHELMQLLEERDTLQLRLSNAIRVNEELRRTDSSEAVPVGESSSAPMVEPLVEQPSPSKSEGPVEIAKEAIDIPIDDKGALALKLSQLHSVSHAKDVRLKDERELRHTQQMSLLAHRDVLSTLPPEAAARLVNANYTLSRDVQSQSSVLLNWLWGKSTPKVVHM